jgi:hypothetical protein
MEYTNANVGASNCSYSSLNNYYPINTGGSSGMAQARYQAAMKADGRQSDIVIGPDAGKTIVPSFGGMGYKSLIAYDPSCSGYFNLANGYDNRCNLNMLDYNDEVLFLNTYRGLNH